MLPVLLDVKGVPLSLIHISGVELAGDEYIDPSDGLIHCKKCGGQRQTVVPCLDVYKRQASIRSLLR